MRVETLRFGPIEVDHESLITFKDGLPGFSKLHLFFLIENADDQLFLWLQSADDPRIAFPVIEPQICSPTYKTPVTEADLIQIGESSLKKVKVLSIVTIPDDPREMTANLRAPILISLNSQQAIQVIAPDSTYPVKNPIFAELQRFIASHSSDDKPKSKTIEEGANSNPFQIHKLKESEF